LLLCHLHFRLLNWIPLPSRSLLLFSHILFLLLIAPLVRRHPAAYYLSFLCLSLVVIQLSSRAIPSTTDCFCILRYSCCSSIP
jgi:hypothetical protein